MKPILLLGIASALSVASGCQMIVGIDDAALIEEEATASPHSSACLEYCSTVMRNCSGDYQVYANESQCLNLCSVWDEGFEEEDVGNTVNCRLTNARLAGETAEPALHCPQAGPGGSADIDLDGRSCTSNCEGLCVGLVQLCVEQFSSFNTCIEDCRTLQDLGTYNSNIGQGPTVQCRLFHLASAAVAPDPHCRHAGGASPCGN